MAVRIFSVLRLAKLVPNRFGCLHRSLNPVNPAIPVCGMSSKKGKKDGCEKARKSCGSNQFFGGCFKKEEPYRRENKKEKGKRCRDPCKDGPCRPGK
ncbi:uncharacterized protein Dana_GF23680 [Drosophila ananassae]|uniref:Uncharacterized protein n=1 Tax=Drosophila ananassae TaxID=7217 RepID=B3M7J2_DROAN|nr:uncharacterized protein LOC6506320 [Drosophila ananassae]EDV40920.2 uncharacterized protein Dana_GF23680 [Drosophila ananassae]